MRYSIFLIVAIFLNTSCKSPAYFADKKNFCIRKIDVTSDGQTIFNKTFDSINNNYSDSIIDARFMIHPKGLNVLIKNKFNGQINIIWDQSSLKSYKISGDGRVIHGGVKYSQATLSLPPSGIPKGDSLIDMVYPSLKVDWVYKSKYDYGWKIYDFVNIGENNQKYIIYGLNEIEKSKIQLGLQINAGSKPYNYLFHFDFNNKYDIVKNTSSTDEYYSLYSNNVDYKVNKIDTNKSKQSKRNAWAIPAFAGLSVLIYYLISR